MSRLAFVLWLLPAVALAEPYDVKAGIVVWIAPDLPEFTHTEYFDDFGAKVASYVRRDDDVISVSSSIPGEKEPPMVMKTTSVKVGPVPAEKFKVPAGVKIVDEE